MQSLAGPTLRTHKAWVVNHCCISARKKNIKQPQILRRYDRCISTFGTCEAESAALVGGGDAAVVRAQHRRVGVERVVQTRRLAQPRPARRRVSAAVVRVVCAKCGNNCHQEPGGSSNRLTDLWGSEDILSEFGRTRGSKVGVFMVFGLSPFSIQFSLLAQWPLVLWSGYPKVRWLLDPACSRSDTLE